MRTTLLAAFGILCTAAFSCKDKVTGPEHPLPIAVNWASSKCLAAVPSTRGPGGPVDSVFLYTFVDSLVMNFNVGGNCCPDSDRFTLAWALRVDTLDVTVTDTAANSCRCICPYMIHASFENLPLNQYIVRCSLCGSGSCSVAYLVKVSLQSP